MTLVGLEKKLGIRASDTATLRFENCRVPRDHLLGSEAVKKTDPKQTGDKGFKGAMATFDASRPIVAAMAVGVGRAALDFVKEELAKQGVVPRYDAPPAKLTAIERDLIEMEADLQAARLLTWRAARLLNRMKPNNLEASQAKAKAGLAVTTHHAAGRGDARPEGLLEEDAGREVDARREDQRHLRRHAADQPADRRAPHPRLLVERAALGGFPLPIDRELLEILVCPETRQPVRVASVEQIAALNQKIDVGELRNRGGEKVSAAIREGLVREDGKVLYPIDDGIPVMLVEQSIAL